ncbi:MAG: hypothetical protein KBT03_08900 [Bacteroidales bacterium]|nr:hypothetical protein [Candidatus Scybalousia scybalohippi]
MRALIGFLFCMCCIYGCIQIHAEANLVITIIDNYIITQNEEEFENILIKHKFKKDILDRYMAQKWIDIIKLKIEMIHKGVRGSFCFGIYHSDDQRYYEFVELIPEEEVNIIVVPPEEYEDSLIVNY